MSHRLARFQIAAHESGAVLFMPLHLVVFDEEEVAGIYGPKKNVMPARSRYLSPPAATSYAEELAGVVVSDMFRSGEASLRARRTRKGAQRPAYSGHNYGVSIDLAVSRTMKNLKLKSKRQLDEWMAERGWYCHRRDHLRKHEEWHYNFFGAEYSRWVKPNDSRTSAGLERMITHRHGRWWHKMSKTSAQRCLQRLGMYDGDLDGQFGPLSQEATAVFQRAWILGRKATGRLDVMTCRTLAYVTADRIEVGWDGRV